MSNRIISFIEKKVYLHQSTKEQYDYDNLVGGKKFIFIKEIFLFLQIAFSL